MEAFCVYNHILSVVAVYPLHYYYYYYYYYWLLFFLFSIMHLNSGRGEAFKRMGYGWSVEEKAVGP